MQINSGNQKNQATNYYNKTDDSNGIKSAQRPQETQKKQATANPEDDEKAFFSNQATKELEKKNEGNYIMVEGLKKQLKLLNKEGKLLKKYPVSIGSKGLFKEKEGDKKRNANCKHKKTNPN